MLFWIVVIALLLIFATAGYASFTAAPYLPTRTQEKRRLLALARIRPGEQVVDLGSGDGRLVFAAARDHGARAVGYEVSLLPYLVSRIGRLFSPGLDVDFRFRDFFHADLSAADAVVCFLTPAAMRRLGPKLAREMKPGSRFVSLAFSVPGMPFARKDKPTPASTAIFVYQF